MSAVDLLLVGCQVALSATFAVAAVGKWRRRSALGNSLLQGIGLPRGIAVAAPALPVAEFGVAVLVLFPGTSAVGAVLASLLLVFFSGFLAIALMRGWRGSCGCFGASERPVGVRSFVRNALLVAVAAPLYVLPPPTFSTAIQALVVMTTLAVAEGWLLGLGLRPSEAAEEPVDSSPEVLLRTLTGHVRRFPSDVVAQAQTAVVFIDPMCSPCKRLLPKLAAMQAAQNGTAGFLIVSRGPADANRSLATAFGLSSMLLQVDFELAELFGVRGTPAAVIIGRSGAASGRPVHGVDDVAALLSLESGNSHNDTRGRSTAAMAPSLVASSFANRLVPADDASGRLTVVLRSASEAARGSEISSLVESVAAAHRLVVLVREPSVVAQSGEHILDPRDRIAGELGLVESPSCRVLDPLGHPIGDAAVGLDMTVATLRALLVRHTEVRPWPSL